MPPLSKAWRDVVHPYVTWFQLSPLAWPVLGQCAQQHHHILPTSLRARGGGPRWKCSVRHNHSITQACVNSEDCKLIHLPYHSSIAFYLCTWQHHEKDFDWWLLEQKEGLMNESSSCKGVSPMQTACASAANVRDRTVQFQNRISPRASRYECPPHSPGVPCLSKTHHLHRSYTVFF